MPPSGTAVYFFSDAHLGGEARSREAERETRLHRFLTHVRSSAQALYILGDLFDFWFEYRTAIPRRHFATLAALREVRQAGVEIHYLTGNHDFWLGSFLADELGIVTHAGPVTLATQGRRAWLHHGDGLVGGDLGYRVLKKVVRHPVSIGLYGWIHPDWGIPLAHRFSNLSREARERHPLDGDRLWREIAEPRFAEGFDTVMVGHFHHVYERRDGPRSFFVLGDWMEHFTYVSLENGVLKLETWPEA
jgi:UDP-2,3-diacylglucosamine hydrolase